MPPSLPHPVLLVYLSGIAELLGGVGLLVPGTRRVAGIGLIVLLLAIFPANIQMLVNWRERGAGIPALIILWLRLPLQAVFIWWAWRFSRAPDPPSR